VGRQRAELLIKNSESLRILDKLSLCIFRMHRKMLLGVFSNILVMFFWEILFICFCNK